MKFIIEGIGRKISMTEQIAIIELYKPLGFLQEDVSLDHPELVFKVIENSGDNMAYFGLTIASYKKDDKSGRGKKH